MRLLSFAFLLVMAPAASPAEPATPPDSAWPRHTIDDRFDGPDGTKLADINGDGLQDVVTGWEGEGLTVVYLNPGQRYASRAWPSVVVGATPVAEDAVFVDLDGNGVLDVVSSSELRVEKVFVHWAPFERNKLLIPQAWRQESFRAVDGLAQWMFAEPIELAWKDGTRRGLALGGKSDRLDRSASLGLLLPGSDPAKADDYVWRPLARVSWTMSIVVLDMNADGQSDILYSDKHGPGSGVWWLENPGPSRSGDDWPKHAVTRGVESAMLIDVVDLDGDGSKEIIVPVDLRPVGTAPKKRAIRILRRENVAGTRWSATDVETPPATGQPKSVAAGDVNGDGRVDLVVTSTGAFDGQMGTYWLAYQGTPFRAAGWQVHRISGPQGIKYDLVHLLDLDGDGDLDALTSEEKQDERGLGVFWYENPTVPVPASPSR